jgi:hypothetical protein
MRGTTPPVFTATIASTTLASVSTAPIDRSSPSVMMISVIGNAMSSRMVDCTATFRRFALSRKLSVSNAKATHSTASVMSAPLALPLRRSRCINSRMPWPASFGTVSSGMVHPQGQNGFFIHLACASDGRRHGLRA